MSPTAGGPPAEPDSATTSERPFASAPAFSLFSLATAQEHRTGRARLEAALWTTAAASALFLGLVFADRALFSAGQSRILDENVLPGIETASTDSAAAAPRRPFVARLEIPAIALSALVVDGVDARTLRRAVGRIPASSRPGEAGDVALAGHRDTDFRSLGKVALGDSLLLRTLDGEFRYEVESIRIVAPQRVDVLSPAAHQTLTLVTCYPFHYVGPAPQRYVVRARQVARVHR